MEHLGVRDIYDRGDSVKFLCTGIEHEFNGQKGYLFISSHGQLPSWMAGKVVSKLDGLHLKQSEDRYKEVGDGWFLFLSQPWD